MMAIVSTRKRGLLLAGLVLLIGALGLAWWLFARDTQEVGAAAALYSACRELGNEQSFDMDSTVTVASSSEVFSYSTEVQGEDFRMTIEGAGAEMDVVVVNGEEYFLVLGEWGRKENFGAPADGELFNIGTVRHLLGANRGSGELCPAGDVTRMGVEQVGGAPAQRFRLIETDPSGFPSNYQTRTLDYWVGSNGLIAKTEQEFDLDTGDSFTFVTTISGVGEPNSITAPSL